MADICRILYPTKTPAASTNGASARTSRAAAGRRSPPPRPVMTRLGRSLAAVLAVAAAGVAAQPPSFLNVVAPLVTTVGCNLGACDGKQSGQSGFRLSLRGFAPDQDYFCLP